MKKSEQYIMVEANNNHNKFWNIEITATNDIITEYGRVGNHAASTCKHFSNESAAEKEFNKLVKSKMKKGYEKLRIMKAGESITNLDKISLENIALDQIEYDKNNQIIINMIKDFCKENIHNITSSTNITFDDNVFKTPCGIVTLDAIKDAKDIIFKIRHDFLNSNIDMRDCEDYCKIIPQKFNSKQKIDYKNYFDKEMIEKQINILSNLDDTITMINKINSNDANKDKVFNSSIEEVTSVYRINKIKNMFNTTKCDYHSCRNLKIKRIFEVKINIMDERFKNTKKEFEDNKKELNIQELWHGTKASNIISILKNGLVIPPSNAKYCTGRMFGNYCYTTDQSTKALNYSYGYWDNNRNNHCYMFLCDVILGKSYIPKGSCYNIPDGYDSMFAKANISGVKNNEMMTPLKQVNIKYLVEFE